MDLKITKSAYQVIKDESLNSIDWESGGLMAGTMKKDHCVIKATRPSPSAVRTSASYTNDGKYDSEILKKLIAEYNGRIKLVGYWHKHPGSMSNPSTTDLKTARRFAAPLRESGDNRPLFFVISNVVGNDVLLYGYYLNDRDEFVPVDMEIVDDNCEEVIDALKKESIVLQPEVLDYWSNPLFQFHRTITGIARLKQEVNTLTGLGYKVTVYDGKQIKIVIGSNDKTIICLPPNEYPLNPPRFYLSNSEIQYDLPIWNSSFTIADLIKKLEPIRPERRSNENHRRRTGTNLPKVFIDLARGLKFIWFNKKR